MTRISCGKLREMVIDITKDPSKDDWDDINQHYEECRDCSSWIRHKDNEAADKLGDELFPIPDERLQSPLPWFNVPELTWSRLKKALIHEAARRCLKEEQK